MGHYGNATIDLLEAVFADGVERAVALMRHSAREYEPGRHDLDNPLTPDGREFALRLGRRLPKAVTVRGYASPPERCMETAELVLRGHAERGGAVTRHRPVEALGVFYALDQIKMWKGMRAAGGMVPFMRTWFAGEVSADAMMPPELAASLVVEVMAAKMRAPIAGQQLDVCVSHDMTLHLVQDRILGEPVDDVEVEYLDALVLFERDGELRLANHRGREVVVVSNRGRYETRG